MTPKAVLFTLAFVAFCTPAMALTPIEVQKLLAEDGASNDGFGRPISLDGDTALFGAIGDEDDSGSDDDEVGAAYVFTRSGNTWSQQAKLLASDGAIGDQFGLSLAIDGDTAVVGSYRDDDNGADSGSAYVFTRSGNTWTEQAKLTANDGVVDDSFGISVSIDGDTIVIGAIFDDDNDPQSGSAYVFTRSGNMWTQQAKLLASDGVAGDRFGRGVSVDGDTAIIGADQGDGNEVDSGSAYVFARTGSTWSQQAKLIAADGITQEIFGIAISLDGDTAIVGAYQGFNSRIRSGSAYVFTRSGNAWAQQAKLIANDGASGDLFGESVDINGDVAVVGALFDDDNGPESGSAYVFTPQGNVWTQRAKIFPTEAETLDFFGGSVAVDNSTLMISANDDENGSNSGAVYVFELRVGTAVEIDIKPGSDTNSINLKSKGNIPVAILTTGAFDATQVDWATVQFGPDGALEAHGRGHVEDVDGDGDMDLILHFSTQQTGMTCGDSEVTLIGETFSGETIKGTSSINIVGC